MSITAARAGRAGRPQLSVRTGPGYKLAEWLNANWSSRTSLTNQEVADRLGISSPGLVSMWRTGRSKVALEWLPHLSRILEVDLAVLLRLWIEQYLGEDVEGMQEVTAIFARLPTKSEAALLEAVRAVREPFDQPFTENEIEAAARLLRTS
jgi:transcriptional regulator with XRE-family HTH domain